jgi:hypothetical protein
MISTNHIQSYTIGAIDGPAGQVCDVYFDDEAWVVRYLVVKTPDRQSVRQVLIPSISLGAPDPVANVFPVLLTRQQVMDSPDVDTDKPVSRQHQHGGQGFYEYPAYWKNSLSGPQQRYPGPITPEVTVLASDRISDERQTLDACADASNYAARRAHDDPHLRSALAVTQYHVHALDGDIGHVKGVLIDEKTWAIRYLIVNTSAWWTGHQALIAPEWIDDIEWVEAMITVDVTRDAIQSAPAYDPTTTPDREFETNTYKHFGRDEYWVGCTQAGDVR